MADTPKPQPGAVRRSNRFIAFHQLTGLCQALRLAVQVRAEPGDVTLALLQRLRAEVAENYHGATINNLPDVDKSTNAVDRLALAELLRMTLLAFLTTEEVAEQRRTMGRGRDPSSN